MRSKGWRRAVVPPIVPPAAMQAPDDDATRLEELVETLDPDDPAVFALGVYDFLTWLQESLALALTE